MSFVLFFERENLYTICDGKSIYLLYKGITQFEIKYLYRYAPIRHVKWGLRTSETSHFVTVWFLLCTHYG